MAAGSAPRVDGRRGVSPRTSGAEGGGAEARRRGRASRVCGGTSLRRPQDDRGDQRPERTAVWDGATPRASSSGRVKHRLSSTPIHSAGHLMPQKASLGTGGRRLAMRKRARSRGGGRSANWARTTPYSDLKIVVTQELVM